MISLTWNPKEKKIYISTPEGEFILSEAPDKWKIIAHKYLDEFKKFCISKVRPN